MREEANLLIRGYILNDGKTYIGAAASTADLSSADPGTMSLAPPPTLQDQQGREGLQEGAPFRASGLRFGSEELTQSGSSFDKSIGGMAAGITASCVLGPDNSSVSSDEYPVSRRS